MSEENQRLDNTIKAVYDVLEKHKDNLDVKDSYEDIKALMEKRNNNQ